MIRLHFLGDSSMKYISTRGGMEPVGFQDAVMTGLAPDGGLLLPETLPDVTGRLEDWAGLTYTELAFEVIRLFATDIPPADLAELITASYAAFDDPEIAPSVSLEDPAAAGQAVRILELFHGPTLAFKDVALQFLGNLFAYIRGYRQRRHPRGARQAEHQYLHYASRRAHQPPPGKADDQRAG
jgi:threonine synthase